MAFCVPPWWVHWVASIISLHLVIKLHNSFDYELFVDIAQICYFGFLEHVGRTVLESFGTILFV